MTPMSVTKKLLGLTLAGGLIIGLAACDAPAESGSGGGGGEAAEIESVGISMPTRELERWINDGEQLKTNLDDAGYTTDLQYAENDTDTQISQIQNQIASGADVLVIAAIDGSVLAPVLQDAADEGITVIAYDRLINGTENVDYYATFDNYLVGQLQGQYIVDQLDLDNAEGPFNLEPFAGSPDDNNAKFFFSGAWDVLKPYIDEGKLVVKSGKEPASNDDWASIGIQGWESAGAQDEMENRLATFYTDDKVDVVLSPNDSLAQGIAEALASSGYTPGTDWPLLTGQDADKASVINLLADKQSMTVWKDTRKLGEQVFSMIEALKAGDDPEVNDEETYDNGEKVVPSYLLTPEVVVKDDVQSKLIDSGFLTAGDVGL
jgi:putative multiple sugar transport system substrate-binding protein